MPPGAATKKRKTKTKALLPRGHAHVANDTTQHRHFLLLLLLLHAPVAVLHSSQPGPHHVCLLEPRCLVLLFPCLVPPSSYTALHQHVSGLANEHR
jgi:hypothetical protein